MTRSGLLVLAATCLAFGCRASPRRDGERPPLKITDEERLAWAARGLALDDPPVESGEISDRVGARDEIDVGGHLEHQERLHVTGACPSRTRVHGRFAGTDIESCWWWQTDPECMKDAKENAEDDRDQMAKWANLMLYSAALRFRCADDCSREITWPRWRRDPPTKVQSRMLHDPSTGKLAVRSYIAYAYGKNHLRIFCRKDE